MLSNSCCRRMIVCAAAPRSLFRDVEAPDFLFFSRVLRDAICSACDVLDRNSAIARQARSSSRSAVMTGAGSSSERLKFRE